MSILNLLVDTLGSLVVMAILLRFLLQLVKADFYNPISQAIVKFTSPLLNPLRRIIPGFGGLDIASLVLAVLVQGIFVVIKMRLSGYMVFMPEAVISLTIYYLLDTVLSMYKYALFILVIASWVAPSSYNPGLMLLQQLTEPLCSRVRRIIPPMGGLDFSVMVVILGIVILQGSLPGLIARLPGL